MTLMVLPVKTEPMRNLSRSIFITIVFLCIVQAVYYYPLLPDRVASHFGPSGRPDAWSGKESFVMIYLLVVAFIASLFPVMGFVLRKTPSTLINLPNRTYWLAPERRQETIDVISRQALWFGSATLLLMLDIFHQSFKIHLGQAQALQHPVLSIALYIGFCVSWSVGLLVKFIRRPIDG